MFCTLFGKVIFYHIQQAYLHFQFGPFFPVAGVRGKYQFGLGSFLYDTLGGPVTAVIALNHTQVALYLVQSAVNKDNGLVYGGCFEVPVIGYVILNKRA